MIIKIHGHYLRVVTIGQLARMSGKSVITLRKWEIKGWLPCANLRTAVVTLKSGAKREGSRVYLNSTAIRLAVVIQKVSQGKQVSGEITQELYNIIRDERDKIKTYANKKKIIKSADKGGL